MLLVVLAGCKPGGTKKVDPPPPEAVCGDGLLNPTLGEQCEGSDLNGASCQSLGFDTGTLGCGSCKYVTAQCVKRCGNGVVDPGEQCDGKVGVAACTTFGYQACTATCQLDTGHCVPVLLQTGASLSVMKGGPAIISDLEPRGLGDLVMAVPSFGRLETFGYQLALGFTTGRKLSFSRTPVDVAAGDWDGDGRQDVASINDDGAIDKYVFAGTAFLFSTFPDAGCPASKFLGVADASVVALGCADAGVFGGLVVQSPSGPITLPVSTSVAALADLNRDGALDVIFVTAAGLESRLGPGWTAGPTQAVPLLPLAIAGGDLDGDGDLDLAALDATGVLLWENTGAGFAAKSAIPSAGARDLKVVDLDLDGQADVVWQTGDKVQVRRNQGSWAFSAAEGTLGPGNPISLAVGDADGDGDLDLAATHSAGGDATVTYVLVNKVR